MQNAECPKCKQEITGTECPNCGTSARNGAAKPRWVKPSPPPELVGRVLTPTPPEMTEEFLRTFNEEEFLAAVRELERTGGVQIDDLIAELERRVDGSV